MENLPPQNSNLEKLSKIMDLFDFPDNKEQTGTSVEQLKKTETAFKSEVLPQNTKLPQKAMQTSSFSALLDALGEQGFSKGQLYLIELAALRNTFTSEQVVQLLESFKLPRYKLKALKILRHQIIDPENYFLLLKVFTSNLDKKKANMLLKDEEKKEAV